MIIQLVKIGLLLTLGAIFIWHSAILLAMYKAENRTHITTPGLARILMTGNLILIVASMIYILFSILE